jgi:hypothetical protein
VLALIATAAGRGGVVLLAGISNKHGYRIACSWSQNSDDHHGLRDTLRNVEYLRKRWWVPNEKFSLPWAWAGKHASGRDLNAVKHTKSSCSG